MLRQYTSSFSHDQNYFNTYALHSLLLVVTNIKSLFNKVSNFHFCEFFPFFNKAANDSLTCMVKIFLECASLNQRYLLLC